MDAWALIRIAQTVMTVAPWMSYDSLRIYINSEAGGV